jgi:hypothetical protein
MNEKDDSTYADEHDTYESDAEMDVQEKKIPLSLN